MSVRRVRRGSVSEFELKSRRVASVIIFTKEVENFQNVGTNWLIQHF